MANVCSNRRVRGCPASFYLYCPAHRNHLNCWEIEDKPCCSVKNTAYCRKCPVYQNAQEFLAETTINQVMVGDTGAQN